YTQDSGFYPIFTWKGICWRFTATYAGVEESIRVSC
ncbi:hypothetical protein A2U01_0099596, partial [Trifolium medium]|nr:hypothetical protein [Trifolium medium]